MSTVSANYGFSVSSEQGRHIISYKQEKYSANNLLPLLVTICFISLLLLLVIQPSSFGSGLFIWIILSTGIFYLVRYLLNLNRKIRQFIIDEISFEIDGRRYAKKDVNSLYLKEGNAQPAIDLNLQHGSGPAKIAFQANPGGLMAASMVNAGHAAGKMVDAAGQKLRNNMAKLNCKIFIRYGNKDVLLAKGITFNTAELIIEKVSELI